ncbi:hypothetical protein NOVO_07855 [Rickettsiales bacterium Ac37b]|nr:hypothetical protein NOVO_07855 [Rickettsiales bacterium Ac37b]
MLLMEKYRSIRDRLTNILLPTERDNKNYKTNVQEYLKELYHIAYEIVEFKNQKGNIRYDYDKGPLIEYLGKHIW